MKNHSNKQAYQVFREIMAKKATYKPDTTPFILPDNKEELKNHQITNEKKTNPTLESWISKRSLNDKSVIKYQNKNLPAPLEAMAKAARGPAKQHKREFLKSLAANYRLISPKGYYLSCNLFARTYNLPEPTIRTWLSELKAKKLIKCINHAYVPGVFSKSYVATGELRKSILEHKAKNINKDKELSPEIENLTKQGFTKDENQHKNELWELSRIYLWDIYNNEAKELRKIWEEIPNKDAKLFKQLLWKRLRFFQKNIRTENVISIQQEQIPTTLESYSLAV